MDFQFEADTLRVLGQIQTAGYLYQGAKPVHWCVDCGSALARGEVANAAKALLILAESLREAALTRYGLNEGAEVVAHTTGQALEGVLLWHPLGIQGGQDRQVPVIVGDHVTADAGTGAGHTAPGPGRDDHVRRSPHR